MKPLDKAIKNHDMDSIVRLLHDTSIDVRGSVLVHIKDALVELGFDCESLRQRGVILSLEDLHYAVAQVQSMPSADFKLRDQVHVKRLFLGIETIIEAFESDRIMNESLATALRGESINLLSKAWAESRLDESLETYAKDGAEHYIKAAFDRWLEGDLTVDVSEVIDETFTIRLQDHYNSVVREEVEGDSLMEYFTTNRDKILVELVHQGGSDDIDIQNLTNGLVNHFMMMIGNKTIEEPRFEQVSFSIKDFYDRETGGRPVMSPRPYFSRAIRNLLTTTEGEHWAAIATHVLDYVQEHPVSVDYQTKLIDNSIKHMISQFKADGGDMPEEIVTTLREMFSQKLENFLKSKALTHDVVYENLSSEVFANLLNDWQAKELPAEQVEALATFITPHLKTVHSGLTNYAVQAAAVQAMREHLQVMSDAIRELQEEVRILKGEKVSSVTVEEEAETTVEAEETSENAIERDASSAGRSIFSLFTGGRPGHDASETADEEVEADCDAGNAGLASGS